MPKTAQGAIAICKICVNWLQSYSQDRQIETPPGIEMFGHRAGWPSTVGTHPEREVEPDVPLLTTHPEQDRHHERLQGQQPGAYPDGQLRTLQRRVKVWRRELAHGMIFPTAAGEAMGTMAAATGAER